eukprot:COSAG03_NODE_1623_length_3757_cov_9.235375_1_plen_67_part_10
MIGMRPRGERRRGEVGEASCRPPIPTPAGRSARGGGNGIGFLQGGVPPPWIFWPPVELFGRTLQAIL